MKSERGVRKSYRARYNKVRSSARQLQVYSDVDPDSLSGPDIADMRAVVEDLTQAFHEFNAYWNCYNEEKTDVSGS